MSREAEANFQSHYAFRFEEQSLEENDDNDNGRHNEGKEPVDREVKHSYLTSCKQAHNKNKISSFLIVNKKRNGQKIFFYSLDLDVSKVVTV